MIRCWRCWPASSFEARHEDCRWRLQVDAEPVLELSRLEIPVSAHVEGQPQSRKDHEAIKVHGGADCLHSAAGRGARSAPRPGSARQPSTIGVRLSTLSHASLRRLNRGSIPRRRFLEVLERVGPEGFPAAIPGLGVCVARFGSVSVPARRHARLSPGRGSRPTMPRLWLKLLGANTLSAAQSCA